MQFRPNSMARDAAASRYVEGEQSLADPIPTPAIATAWKTFLTETSAPRQAMEEAVDAAAMATQAYNVAFAASQEAYARIVFSELKKARTIRSVARGRVRLIARACTREVAPNAVAP